VLFNSAGIIRILDFAGLEDPSWPSEHINSHILHPQHLSGFTKSKYLVVRTSLLETRNMQYTLFKRILYFAVFVKSRAGTSYILFVAGKVFFVIEATPAALAIYAVYLYFSGISCAYRRLKYHHSTENSTGKYGDIF